MTIGRPERRSTEERRAGTEGESARVATREIPEPDIGNVGFGIDNGRRQLRLVGRKPKVGVVAFRADRIERIATPVEPRQTAEQCQGLGVSQRTVLRNGKGPEPPARPADLLRDSKFLAAGFETLRIKSLSKKRALVLIEKVARRGIKPVRVNIRNEKLLRCFVKRPDVNARLSRQSASNSEEEVTAVR